MRIMFVRYRNRLYGMYETEDTVHIYTKHKEKALPNFQYDEEFGRYVAMFSRQSFRELKEITEVFELLFSCQYQLSDNTKKTGKLMLIKEMSDCLVQEFLKEGLPCTLDRMFQPDMWKQVPVTYTISDVLRLDICVSCVKSSGVWHVPAIRYRKSISMDEWYALYALYQESCC